MFCPKCATQNIDGASYCRACGANISLVPQALTGQLPTMNQPSFDARSLRRKWRREPSIETAIRSLMMGITFAVISLIVSRYGGAPWWFWLLIPAAMSFAKGFSELARLRLAKEKSSTSAQPQLNTVRPQDLPVPRTGELIPPVPSVTEGTTRHLGTEAPTQHFDSFESQKPS
jgi:zinc-ribbon domain